MFVKICHVYFSPRVMNPQPLAKGLLAMKAVFPAKGGCYTQKEKLSTNVASQALEVRYCQTNDFYPVYNSH